MLDWNQKNLDYEIETVFNRQCRINRHTPWNQKNLDYEIETTEKGGSTEQASHAWNQKNLDYEIETQVHGASSLWSCALKPKEPRLRDWNG